MIGIGIFRYLAYLRVIICSSTRIGYNKITDIMYNIVNGNMESWTTVQRMSSEWKSVLAKKQCRDQRYYLYDIDIPNNGEYTAEVEEFVTDLRGNTEVRYFGKSKTGYAVVCNPFNPHLVKLPRDTELKNDDYLYVDCFNSQEVT